MAYIEREVERSIPELRLGGLLNNHEIRQIVKRRTYYAERKFRFNKHDFLRYLQFENKVFRLVMLRCQTKRELSTDDIINTRKLFITRINSIYNMALRRCSHDKQLWLLSFDFAKRYSERISRAKFLRALLLHPNWIYAWIEAANYEYEWNKNPMNARLLFQRAIALNPKCASLYLAFFKMELNVVQQHLNWSLASKQNDGDEDEKEREFDWKKELKVLGKDGGETGGEKDGADAKDAKDAKEVKDAEQVKQDELLEEIYAKMQVPKMIFRFALTNIEDAGVKHALIKQLLLAIPDKQRMQSDESLLQHVEDAEEKSEAYAVMLQRFSSLLQYMFEYLEQHYFHDAVVIQLLARKNLQSYSKQNTVVQKSVEMAGCQVFERAILLLSVTDGKLKKKTVKQKNTRQQREEYIVKILYGFVGYLQERMAYFVDLKTSIAHKRDRMMNEDSEDEDEDDDKEVELSRHELHILSVYHDIMNYLVLRMLDAFKKLQKLSAMKASAFHDWILTLTQICEFDEAFRVIKLAVARFPRNMDLWRLYSNLHARQICIAGNVEQKNEHYRKALAACMKGVQSVSTKQAPLLWQNMMDIMMAQLTYLSMTKSETETVAKGSDDDDDEDDDVEDKDLVQQQIEVIHRAFRKGIQHCLSHNESLKQQYLQWVVMYHAQQPRKQLEVAQWFQTQTMKCSPSIYKLLFAVSESVLLSDIESITVLSSAQKNNIDKVDRCYKKAINEHGKTRPEIWLWYIEWSRKYNKVSTTSAIHQRAMKTLDSGGLQTFLQMITCRYTK